jgi:hypothetical protein
LFELEIRQPPLCFLNFEGLICLDSYWPWHLGFPKRGACFVFSVGGAVQNSPLPADHISFTDRREERPITT